jgi:hypothetical protein
VVEYDTTALLLDAAIVALVGSVVLTGVSLSMDVAKATIRILGHMTSQDWSE